MRLFKVLAKICGVCFLCIGILLYIVHDTSQNVISKEIVNEISEQMNDVLLSSLESMGISSELLQKAEQYLPQKLKDGIKNPMSGDAENSVEKVKAQLLESEELQNLSNTYLTAILDGIIDGSTALSDINTETKKLTRTFIPKLTTVMNITVNEHQIEQISDRMVDKLDLQTRLTDITEQIHEQLSDKQILALKAVRIIQGETAQWLALGFMVIGLFLIIITTQSAIKWTWYAGAAAIICGILLWGGALFVERLLEVQLQAQGGIITALCDGLFTAVRDKGISLCLVGFGCFGGYGFIRQLIKYQKR